MDRFYHQLMVAGVLFAAWISGIFMIWHLLGPVTFWEKVICIMIQLGTAFVSCPLPIGLFMLYKEGH